jgi:hypothetical protein
MWVLLDEEGEAVRYFDYAHEGAVEIVEKKLSYMELLDVIGECLF